MKIISLLTLWLLAPSLYSQVYTEVASSQNIIGTFGEAGFYGGGVSFVDFNQDGLDDLTFSSEDGQDIFLYQNTGNGFTLLPDMVSCTGQSHQILWVDYDNDADKDLFIAVKYGQNKFYRNDGNMNMSDITGNCGINIIDDRTVTAAFSDVNLDGFLDLYVGNSDLNMTNFLYLNNGAGGFSDYTLQSGASDGQKFSLAVSFFDYDNDGDPDLFIANDKFTPNSLYENNGNGIFTDVSESSGIAMVFDAMNAGMGDCNMDGLLDIYVTNGPAGNVLYGNNGDGTFTDIASAAGVTMNKVCWGGNFFDYDNDMDEDLYVCAANNPNNQENQLFNNNGFGYFNPVAVNGFPGDDKPSFSNAIGDLNNDGLPDIAVSNDENENFQLWQNAVSNNNHWVKIQLIGTESNREGIGSKLELRVAGERRILYSYCGQAFQAQNADYTFFGTAAHTSVDSLFVHWPSGIIDLFRNLAVDHIHELREGSSAYNPPLPLYLKDIHASVQKMHILVEWELFSALGVREQQLQRSTDGRHFVTIHKELFSISEDFGLDFKFQDYDVISGREYIYRIRNIDQDGSISYSQLVSAIMGDFEATGWAIIGNPATDRLRLFSEVPVDSNLEIDIIDRHATQINRIQFSTKGEQEFYININYLTAGQYFLRIYGAGKPESMSFFKY